VKPVLLVVAGPNGSGKTTVTVRLRAERWSHGVEYLNPDDVARDRFGDWNSAAATLDAARWTTERREALLARGEGIAFETVFSSEEKVAFVARARARGYFVRVFFIGTTDPRINAARVAGRVMEGGHTVPIEKIVSRYGKSIANLAAALRLADRVYIYDNSIDGVEARLCARTYEGALRKVYGPLPEWVEDAVGALPLHAEFVDLRTG
jgi:predicted ABC-type ATPase